MSDARESEAVDGRVARRLDAMRRVQTEALRLFEARGFAAVTVDDIASAAKVGPASVYRNFGTKEGVVLWDEYDPRLLDGIAARLASQPPLEAARDAVLDALSEVYTRDRERILQRARLMLAEPSLIAANAAQQEAFRGALAQAFRKGRSIVEADALAAVVLGLLDATVREWARKDGKLSMSSIVRKTFGFFPSP